MIEEILSQCVILPVIFAVFLVTLDVLDSELMDLLPIFSVNCKALDSEVLDSLIDLSEGSMRISQVLQMLREGLTLRLAALIAVCILCLLYQDGDLALVVRVFPLERLNVLLELVSH